MRYEFDFTIKKKFEVDDILVGNIIIEFESRDQILFMWGARRRISAMDSSKVHHFTSHRRVYRGLVKRPDKLIEYRTSQEDR